MTEASLLASWPFREEGFCLKWSRLHCTAWEFRHHLQVWLREVATPQSACLLPYSGGFPSSKGACVQNDPSCGAPGQAYLNSKEIQKLNISCHCPSENLAIPSFPSTLCCSNYALWGSQPQSSVPWSAAWRLGSCGPVLVQQPLALCRLDGALANVT